MTRLLRNLLPVFALLALALPAYAAAPASAAKDPRMEPRILGDAKAPVTVDEYVSLTCTHCAEFYTTTLPALKTKYVDTGKVKFILHDFPLDGIALKAAALARCMPADEYYPFIDVLYQNQMKWAFVPDPDSVLVQYATLGGLGPDRAKACLADSKLQDAIAAERTDATNKFKIDATPTFILNNGAATIQGAQPEAAFAAAFDKLLNKK